MQPLIVALAAWLTRQQEAFIEYLKTENRVLKGRLGDRRLVFTDTERRLLVRHAKAVGRKKLFALDPIVSPDTLLRGQPAVDRDEGPRNERAGALTRQGMRGREIHAAVLAVARSATPLMIIVFTRTSAWITERYRAYRLMVLDFRGQLATCFAMNLGHDNAADERKRGGSDDG